MGFQVTTLWSSPEVNELNKKARSIPILNPINIYGRVFFFSWFGFFIAFWSWYALPPLLTLTIKKDLHLSQVEISNSNIISLVATLLVRLVAGPACDRFGPKNTFAACLLLGAIPTFLAGTVTSATGLMVLRFFVGILGGSFVPCQVWSTGFFDKNVVGTANSLTAGWGNSGGGITYFVMPAIVNSLINNQNMTPHVAWRVSFVVPGILIVTTALSLLLLCPDTPTGKWSSRTLLIQGTPIPSSLPRSKSGIPNSAKDEKCHNDKKHHPDKESNNIPQTLSPETINDPKIQDIIRQEIIVTPTLREATEVIFNLQTLALALSYLTTFGAELSINSILGAYYLHNFPSFTQSTSGNWASIFGLLNLISRPFGGIISDLIYRRLLPTRHPSPSHQIEERNTTSIRGLWGKKIWLTVLMICTGILQIIIGTTNSHHKVTMISQIAIMAFFLEASNGANFSLVPHIHPYANGIVSGVAGAAGNLGGILFAIIFRYLGMDYGKTFWVVGIVTVGVGLGVSWIRPVSRGEFGGR